MILKRITKKQSQIARKRAEAIIKNVRKILKDKYVFANRMVGSGALGTMVEDENGEYDLDYQLLLTCNSKVYDKSKRKFPNPTQIKNVFFAAFKKSLAGDEEVQNSTTAITIINRDNKPYHIDFVIIKTYPKNDFIIRRNNKSESHNVNEFTWNRLPDFNIAYSFFKGLSINERQYLVNKIIIPKKCEEKAKDDNDPTKISSAALFVREVNNYRCKIKNRK